MKRRMMVLVLVVAMLASMVFVPVSASAAKKVKILQVTEDRARIRLGPSSAYGVITSLKKGSKVFYLNRMKDSFAYICSSGGVKGYMYKGYLKSYGTVYSNQIYRCTKKGYLYKKASSGSSHVAKLSKNQHVVVYQVSGSWAYIKTLGGKGGYVKKSILTKAT